jgi:hypothetical protein
LTAIDIDCVEGETNAGARRSCAADVVPGIAIRKLTVPEADDVALGAGLAVARTLDGASVWPPPPAPPHADKPRTIAPATAHDQT